MKVLKGSLTESRFATPTESDVQNQRPMTKLHDITYKENEVTYMADTLGVHCISNPHPTEYAVSLHRTPPLSYLYTHLLLTTMQCTPHPTQRLTDATYLRKTLLASFTTRNAISTLSTASR
jgi:hypothetical protein